MITPNETLQLNELLSLKSLSLTKTTLMSPLVTNADLKEILMKDAELCENHVKDLRRFLEMSSVTSELTDPTMNEKGENAP